MGTGQAKVFARFHSETGYTEDRKPIVHLSELPTPPARPSIPTQQEDLVAPPTNEAHMFRPALLAALTLVPNAGQAQTLHLETVFENACVAPFDLFFGETEDYLRGWGFEIYPNDDWTTVEHQRTGMQGFYSSNPEDMFC